VRCLGLLPLAFQESLARGQPLDDVGKCFEDAEDPDDDDAVTDANMPVHDVFPKSVRSLGQADQEKRNPLYQVGDRILDKGLDRTADLFSAVVHRRLAVAEHLVDRPRQSPPSGPLYRGR
jgi:hypothetical protein